MRIQSGQVTRGSLPTRLLASVYLGLVCDGSNRIWLLKAVDEIVVETGIVTVVIVQG